MKKLLLAIFVLVSCASFGQSVINRSGAANTVQDARWMALYNMYAPRFADTTAASLQKGIDSSGAIIYTYDVKGLWYRQHNPKQWVQLSGVGTTTFQQSLTASSIITTDNYVTGQYVMAFGTSVDMLTSFEVYGRNHVNINSDSALLAQAYYVEIEGKTSFKLTGNAITPVTDTTLYKPAVLDAAGNLKTGYWFGGGGVTTFQQSLTASSVLTSDNDVTGGYRMSFGTALSKLATFHAYATNNINIISDAIATVQGGNLAYVTSPYLLLEGTSTFQMVGAAISTVVDSTTYKPLVIDGSGNVKKAYWFGGSGGGGSGNTNSNIGSGYRWAVPNTNNVKTVFGGVGILIDSSSNSNALTFKVDTFTIGTRDWVKHSIDSAANIADSFPVLEPLVVIDGGADADTLTVGLLRTMGTYQQIMRTERGEDRLEYVYPNPIVANQKSSVPFNYGRYTAFPSFAWTPTKDSSYMVVRDGDTHGANGAALFRKTWSGSDWSDPDTISINGVHLDSAASVEIGMGSKGRLILAYVVLSASSTYDSIYVAYNDNGTSSFTAVPSILPAANQKNPFVFGSPFEIAPDTLMMVGYCTNTAADTTKAITWRSTDNGLTWVYYSTALETKAGGSFPDGTITEFFAVKARSGTRAGNTTLIGAIRSETYNGYHYQVKSTDGGLTWTNQSDHSGTAEWMFQYQNATGLPNSSGNDYPFPATMVTYGDNMYAFVCRRGNNGDYSLRVWKASVDDVIADAGNWGNYTTVYRALDAYKGSDNDWGYGRGYWTPTHALNCGFYDMDISDRPGVDGIATAKRIRTVTIPVLGNNYFHSFAAANQSITSGTETTVTTDYIWIDSEGAYNSDSAKIYIPQEGWYEVTAKVQFDTSALGTYRLAKLYAVDWGATYGVTPAKANYLLDKKVIQPSTSSEFNFISLQSKRVYLYQGMEIRLTVQHDKGSSLNILSAASTGAPQTDEGRAEITFKKVN